MNAANVAESHVCAGLEIGEGNAECLRIGRERQQLSDVGQIIDTDGGKVGTVVDVHGAHFLQLDTSQRIELCVANVDSLGGLNSLRKVQALQTRESNPLDSVDIGEGRECKVGKDCESCELPCSGN